MPANRVIVIVIGLCVSAFVITFIIGKLFKGLRVYKYIPSIISALGGIGFYIKASFYSRGFEDIGFLLLAIAAAIFTITSVITAVMMDILMKKSN